MYSVGIDLAERHSAACVLAENYSVLGEFPLDLGERVKEVPWDIKLTALEAWAHDIRAYSGSPGETIIYIEGVPPRAFTVRPAQTQGALMAFLWKLGYSFDFCTPGEWQRHHGYSRKIARQTDQGRGSQTTKGWAKQRCAEYGYDPEAVGGQGSKVKIDVRDAYLIARYGLDKALSRRSRG